MELDEKKIYQYFKVKYPDPLERHQRVMEWCVICKAYSKVSEKVWNLLDLAEE